MTIFNPKASDVSVEINIKSLFKTHLPFIEYDAIILLLKIVGFMRLILK